MKDDMDVEDFEDAMDVDGGKEEEEEDDLGGTQSQSVSIIIPNTPQLPCLITEEG